MRILVLSRNRALYTTRRFVEAAKALGHRASVLDPPGFEGLERATGVDIARAIVEYGATFAGGRFVARRSLA